MSESSSSAHFEIQSGGSRIEVVNLDCIDGMRDRLRAGSVDVVVTSPPYNLGTDYAGYDDTMARGEYLSFMGRWGAVVRETLSDRGSLFLNIGGKPSQPWGPFEVLHTLREHFELQNVIHWIKSIAIQKEDVGRYPGINANVSVGHYKLALGVEYQDKSNVRRWSGSSGEDVRCRGNTWFVPYRTIQNRAKQRPHPASFPVKIPKMCVQLHGTERADLVVDPFLGIGNSAVACVQLGAIDFVGFETDPDYCAQSRTAIEEAVAA